MCLIERNEATSLVVLGRLSQAKSRTCNGIHDINGQVLSISYLELILIIISPNKKKKNLCFLFSSKTPFAMRQNFSWTLNKEFRVY
jgi:hypothetical protein